MRVFYFLTSSGEGGAQSVVYELLYAHNKRGDSVMVMAYGSGWLSEQATALGFEYVPNPFMRKTYNPFTILRAALTYIKVVHSYKPDIISCHSSFSGIIGRFFKPWRTPAVYTSHGWGFTYGKGFFRFLNVLGEQLATLRTSAIICVSKRDRDVACRTHIAPSKKLHLIYNGVDGDRYRSTDHTQTIGFVGRFAWPKKQMLLIDAFACVPVGKRERWKLVFIGSGPDEANVRKKAEKALPAEQVAFLGSIPNEEVFREVSHWSLTVLLSASEGFPMSVIGSLSLGIPVVASDVGGISEAVDESVGALVSKDATSEEIATVLEQLMTDNSTRTALSTAALERSRQFSAARMVEETFSLYDSLT